MAGGISIGSIYADLDVDSSNMVRGLAGGRQAMAAMESELKRLEADLKAGAIDMATYGARTAAVTAELTKMASAMQAAFSRVGTAGNGLDLVDRKLQAGASSAGRMGQALMQLGYMADDAQFGLAALSNNVAPLVYGLTGNAGLAAAAQVAAVAGIQLVKRWDEVREVLGDTSGADEAKKSVEGLSEALKKLQEDADNFSWGDSLARLFGLSPDAGKQQAAENMRQVLEGRQKAEAAAKDMDNDKTDAEKREEKRYAQAVLEAGGSKALAEKLGKEDYDKQGASPFLSTDRGFTGIGTTEKEKYDELRRIQKEGIRKLTEQEQQDLDNYEVKAKREAVRRARERIGAGAFDATARDQVARQIGGKAGEVIGGRDMTAKDDKEAMEILRKQEIEEGKQAIQDDKDRDAAWKAEAAEREKQAREIALKANPNLRTDADRLARKEAEQPPEMVGPPKPRTIPQNEVNKLADEIMDEHPELDRRDAQEQAREELESEANDRVRDEAERRKKHDDPVQKLKAKILAKSPELTDEDAEGLAREEMERTKKEDPEDRVNRIKAADRQQIAKANPDAQRDAEAAIAMTMGTGGDMAKKFAEGLRDKLKDRGLAQEDADAAVGDFMGDAQQKVRDRLAGIRGPRNEGEQQPSHSEVMRTADLTNKVQSAISSEGPMAEAKKHTSQHEKQIELLQHLVDRKSLEFEVH